MFCMFAQCQPWPTVLCEPPVMGCPNTHLSALSGNADHVLPAGSPSPGSTPPAAFPAGRYLDSAGGRVPVGKSALPDRCRCRGACQRPQGLPGCSRERAREPLGSSPRDLSCRPPCWFEPWETTAIHVQPRVPHPRTGDSWDDYRLQPPIRKVNVLLKRSNC